MNFEAAQKAILAISGKWESVMGMTLSDAAKALLRFKKAYRKGKWKMTAKTGRNKRERQRDQVRLKGRGCRVHRGRYPTRGKGTTSRSR